MRGCSICRARFTFVAWLMVSAVWLACIPAGAEKWTPLYSVTELLTLGGHRSSYGYGINDSGQTVGRDRETGQYNMYAVRWDGATATYLRDLGSDYASIASGINESGQVAGMAYLPGSDSPRAVRWDGTRATDLGTLGGGGGQAYGINDGGQVVGIATTPGNAARHAVRWTVADNGTITATDLGTLGGRQSTAYGINNSGQVVGDAYAPGGWDHAVRWTVADNGAITATDLHATNLYGYTSIAHGINDSGQIVGGTGDRATLWDVTGAPTYLGTTGGDYIHSVALGISDSGWIVGYADNQSFSAQHAALWVGDDAFDLNTCLLGGTSGWTLGEATGINELGQIVGTGTLDGEQRAFLLTLVNPPPSATPELSTWALLGCSGLFGVGMLRRRRVA